MGVDQRCIVTSQYSGRSLQCSDLNGLDSSSDFQSLQFFSKLFGTVSRVKSLRIYVTIIIHLASFFTIGILANVP